MFVKLRSLLDAGDMAAAMALQIQINQVSVLLRSHPGYQVLQRPLSLGVDYIAVAGTRLG